MPTAKGFDTRKNIAQDGLCISIIAIFNNNGLSKKKKKKSFEIPKNI